MAEENLTLKESIEAAASEQTQPSVEEEVKTEEQPSAEEEVKAAEGSAEGQPDEEVVEALAFYRALRDPAQQKEIITGLALRAGLINAEKAPLTPKEEKKYGQLLEEILGEEYPDLKNKLTPVLAALEKQTDDKILYLKSELDRQVQARAVADFEVEFTSFLKENKVTEEEAGRMMKEIQELPPSVGRNGHRIPLTQYLSKIYKLVSSEKKVVQQEVKRVEKINANLKERSSQLSSDVGDDRLRKGSRLPSVREAVAAAARGESFDE